MNACMLLQNNRLAQLVIPFADYAHGVVNDVYNTPHPRMPLFDRSMTATFDPDNCGVDWSRQGPVLVYGSVDFIKTCAKSPHLSKYVFNDRVGFSADVWEQKCGVVMLDHDGCKMTVKELCEQWSINDPIRQHIRPLSEDKAFIAKVFTWAEWFDDSQRLNLSDDLECWVSSDKGVLKQEWRCWIIDGRLVTVTQYKANGKVLVSRNTPKKVAHFAHRFAHQTPRHPAKMFVMDLCLDAYGEVRIVEFNPINSSGWYDRKAVDKIIWRWVAALEKI